MADTQTPADQPVGDKASSRKSYVVAALLAVAATVWVASGAIDPEPLPETRTAAERQADTNEPVRVQVARFDAAERPRRIIVAGRTDAIESAELRAETAGRVTARPGRKGIAMERGAILLELATDDRVARLRDAEAAVKSADIQFNAAKNLQRKQFESEVRLAESEAVLAEAKAELEAVRLDIARTKIRVPFDGFVEDIGPTVGDYVSEEDVVATVVDLDPLRVIVNVTERDIGGVRTDDLVTVRLPDGRELGGTVTFVSRVANEVTRTFRVDVWVDNPGAVIPAGMTAEVSLDIGSRNAHKIAKSALTLDDQGRLGVRAVDNANVVRFFPIVLLDDTPEGVWVAGLPSSVNVIVVGHEFVTEGQTVAPFEAAAERNGDQS